VNNKERLYLLKYAGAAAGIDAGYVGTGAEKGVGALSGVTAGLGATPIPVLHKQDLARHNKDLSALTDANNFIGGNQLDKDVKAMQAKTEGLANKVPTYMK
tara:strand:+ start:168 stop:470 length:303 start_codon:yes stop_codon:yes gene_type:complete